MIGRSTRSADPLLLEHLHQRRLGESRGSEVVLLRRDLQPLAVSPWATGGRTVSRSASAESGRRRPRRRRATGEVDDVAVRLEDCLDGPVRLSDLEHHAAPLGVLHLARERALPDQVVDLCSSARAPCGSRRSARSSRPRGGWPRGPPGRSGPCPCRRAACPGTRPVSRLDRLPGQLDGETRERHRVGPHVGDEAVLVEPWALAWCAWRRSAACGCPPAGGGCEGRRGSG